MRTVMATAFAALLALGGAVSISAAQTPTPPASGDGATEPMEQPADSTGMDAPAEDSTSESEPDSGSDQEGVGKSGHPNMDVHRHRPGACPEGPPCKSEN
jgi:hypothetical protein